MENHTHPIKQSDQTDRNKQLYEHGLTLVEHELQKFWFVFGAYLLAETVLLGGIGSMAKDSPTLVPIVSLLGFLVTVVWWTSYRYNHSLYLLRVAQLKKLEAYLPDCKFFTEGEELIRGEKVCDIKMPCDAVRPRTGITLLIMFFALVFLAAIWWFSPWQAHQ